MNHKASKEQLAALKASIDSAVISAVSIEAGALRDLIADVERAQAHVDGWAIADPSGAVKRLRAAGQALMDIVVRDMTPDDTDLVRATAELDEALARTVGYPVLPSSRENGDGSPEFQASAMPAAPTVTVDTPEYNVLISRLWNTTGGIPLHDAKNALTAHIDAHAAAVAARAVADVQAELSVERAALADAVRHVGNLKERASTPQQHAQAALSDEQLVSVLNSCGIDTYPSRHGLNAIQVSATSLPWVREVVRRCIALMEASQQPAATTAAQTARPIPGLPFVDLATPIREFEARKAAAPAVQVQDERAAFEQQTNDSRFFPAEINFARLTSPSGRDEYVNSHLQSRWEGWQARASLTKGQP